MKKILVVLMALVMVFSMAACGGSETVADNSMIEVEFEIDYPDGSGMEDVNATIATVAGTSALEMLMSYAEDEGFEVVLDENSPTIYITSINGVEQTNDAGWVYKINDEITMEEASEIILTDGMVVTWEYMSWSDF